MLLRRLFSKQQRFEPDNWVIVAGDRQLFRLEFDGFYDGFFWMKYRVVHLNGTQQMWRDAFAIDRSSSALPWNVVHLRTGQEYPLEAFDIVAKTDRHEAQLKFLGRHNTDT